MNAIVGHMSGRKSKCEDTERSREREREYIIIGVFHIGESHQQKQSFVSTNNCTKLTQPNSQLHELPPWPYRYAQS